MPWSAEDVYLLPLTGEVVIREPVTYRTQVRTLTIGDQTVQVTEGIVEGSVRPRSHTRQLKIGDKVISYTRIIIREI